MLLHPQSDDRDRMPSRTRTNSSVPRLPITLFTPLCPADDPFGRMRSHSTEEPARHTPKSNGPGVNRTARADPSTAGPLKFINVCGLANATRLPDRAQPDQRKILFPAHPDRMLRRQPVNQSETPGYAAYSRTPPLDSPAQRQETPFPASTGPGPLASAPAISSSSFASSAGAASSSFLPFLTTSGSAAAAGAAAFRGRRYLFRLHGNDVRDHGIGRTQQHHRPGQAEYRSRARSPDRQLTDVEVNAPEFHPANIRFPLRA